MRAGTSSRRAGAVSLASISSAIDSPCSRRAQQLGAASERDRAAPRPVVRGRRGRLGVVADDEPAADRVVDVSLDDAAAVGVAGR